MALLKRSRPAPIINTTKAVPPTAKKAFPTVAKTIVETPIVLPTVNELPKSAMRRPIPKRQAVDEASILAKMNQRQRQIILHSVLYYRMDTNIVTDTTWNRWASELVKLQADYPELLKTSVFYEDMKDFDGMTGFHLADHAWGMHKALYIIKVQKSLKGE